MIYDMQSVNRNGRNNSQKNMSVLMNDTYTYDDRYTLNAVFNRSGSAYLPDGDKFAKDVYKRQIREYGSIYTEATRT